MFIRVAARLDHLSPKGPFLQALQVIRHLLTRPECFRLEREFAGSDLHRGEKCTLSSHTEQLSRKGAASCCHRTGELPFHGS